MFGLAVFPISTLIRFGPGCAWGAVSARQARLVSLAVFLAASCFLGCSGQGSSSPDAPLPPALNIPAQGGATTLDMAEWNLEWFGDASNGPSNEVLQQTQIRAVIAGVDCDVWGLEEVVSGSAFGNLVAGLPGYAGLLSNDASVLNGAAYYGVDEQKVALLYKTDIARVQSARLILTANDYDFAGRPPMEVELSVTLNGTTSTLYVICVHAKAFNDAQSWQRRLNASVALKTYLDTVRPNERVIVMGDFNDDLDTSITSGHDSPYKNFVEDTARYSVVTKALSDARIATTIGYADAIDHHIVSNELAAKYLAASAQAFPANLYLSDYAGTTTDHLPVITRWSVP